MKKLILLTSLFAALLAGCDYLDIVPDDTATLEDAFKNETTAENFIFTCYSFQYDYFSFRNAVGMMTSNEYAAAYHWGPEWFPFVRYNEGNDNSTTPFPENANNGIDNLWLRFYQGIRQCYIFLNNIEEVTPVMMSASEYEANKQHWTGEAWFLIAYYHHLLLQNYGPVVVIEGETKEKQPRLPLDECVAKIAGFYDKAIASLPPTVTAADYGRASQVIARAMKAKLLLYAASPLFNGNTDYAGFKDKEGRQLISQTPDKEKWKTAMTAIEEAITFAKGQGKDLYTYDKPDPAKGGVVTDPLRQAYLNARFVLVDNWNKEILWACAVKEISDGWQRHAVVKGIGTRPYTQSAPVGGIGPTLTAVKIFYTASGLPPETDPTFPWDDRMKVAPGDSTCQLHRNREPRFYAAIGHDRGTYEFNGGQGTVQEYTLKLRFNEGNGCHSKGTDHLYSGYAVKKNINPEGQATSSAWSYQPFAYPLMRLADLYLAYAEACAEYQGSLDAKAQEYINAVRSRAGIPDLDASLSGDNLVKAVRRERMIELVFESQWHYDLRRWKMAKDWHKDDKDGMWGLHDEGATAEEFYVETPLPAQKYVFHEDGRGYLMPIKVNYVNTNELLVQNPGY
ncbi:MAG: RagB/SusD family nutrient uptake outer membrane protein [Prevotellaceae bacterium]|jgi:hypothetical protein|nr:RagB/SusD family nutrient uptake outer membrane protein [Prevotellaceae bacterium]